MKTKNDFKTLANLKIFMVLPLLAIALFTISSCGKSKTSAPEQSDPVYVKVDELPVFTGGDKALLDYIAANTIYPEEAKKNNIQGKVVVKMVVLKDGSISQVEVLSGVNPLLDAEAVRVTSSLPKFEKPGILAGKPVSVAYMIPIIFKLE